MDNNWRKISVAPVLSGTSPRIQQIHNFNNNNNNNNNNNSGSSGGVGSNNNNNNNNNNGIKENNIEGGVPKPMRFQIQDNDFYTYLLGSWKRNLEWKEFGGLFQHIRTSNTVVLIEEFTKYDIEPGYRHLKWSFGKSLNKNELHFGYSMRFKTAPKNIETYLEWTYIGTPCHGKFFSFNNVAVLNFFQSHSTVIVTYRIVDQDTMSVCVVEVDEKQTPSIQYGNMYRIDPTLYVK